ncbi:MAG: 30S ribosomal protein S3 [Desulfurella sp.]|uniref:Small ribosomal subunit protein uS3 n=2 Tax=Desulfurella TaxID=33001 RepID=A0A1G6KGV4_9BACT|nr:MULTISPECIES: 30S ribosomal protein S3 [Desulfurella]AHF96693.1 30S ribosomal protein S3 [Desulfurella acetivorans A63]HEX13994.1 30S ribosomal protein S3 [Desulfurella acetivorans]PMP67916.1 MAG: 30S ribosomal protein S3 [Desulfurella multipotens]PMP87073.1 MAG: 30S ribosomal protein S3 [Desulfurella sp.]SDC30041.1 small subunit ribosomal protein S3 [Desulfurella multipotens]
MGQKVNPIGLRLGIIKTWSSRWFAKNDFKDKLLEDQKIRKEVKAKLYYAGISNIEIERKMNKLTLNIYAARPGILIGKKGSEVEKIKSFVNDLTKSEVSINIREVNAPETDAQLIAENIALQIEKRTHFRRAMKKAAYLALRKGVQGIKIQCAGKLGGVEMARTEWIKEGRVPLTTLRANIDYGFAESLTTAGIIGIKVWVFKGYVMD